MYYANKLSHLFLSIYGRISRKQYWLSFVLILFIAYNIKDTSSIKQSIYAIAIMYTTVSLYIKRLHDFGRSAKIVLWPVSIQIVSYFVNTLIFLLILKPSDFDRFAVVATAATTTIGIIPIVVWIIFLIVIGIPDSEDGVNMYGYNPKQAVYRYSYDDSYYADGNFVFISYNSSDRWRVEDIVRNLDAVGIRYFIDKNIELNKEWEEALVGKILMCSCFMVVWSKNSIKFVENNNVNKNYVILELMEAMRRNRNILQVRIDEVVPSDDIFSEFDCACLDENKLSKYNFARLEDWHGNSGDENWSKVVNELEKYLRKDKNYTGIQIIDKFISAIIPSKSQFSGTKLVVMDKNRYNKIISDCCNNGYYKEIEDNGYVKMVKEYNKNYFVFKLVGFLGVNLPSSNVIELVLVESFRVKK